MQKFKTKKVVGSVVLLACLVTFSSCGYFLYPERRGQTGGQIDPAILILDCVGLLFWILPGAIALAVDFSSGAIYLPGGKKKSEIEIIYADKTMLTKEGYLESIVSTHLGKKIHLDSNSVIMLKPNPGEDVRTSLAYLNSHINDYKTMNRFVFEHNYYASGKRIHTVN